ncbi:hypothetical protein, partial [Agromyces seonyuensis]|uniref:hypothetical protein n=1 Tax=Agromyces seonyuensis TaxID=2662446 RepID=UPI001F32B532
LPARPSAPAPAAPARAAAPAPAASTSAAAPAEPTPVDDDQLSPAEIMAALAASRAAVPEYQTNRYERRLADLAAAEHDDRAAPGDR